MKRNPPTSLIAIILAAAFIILRIITNHLSTSTFFTKINLRRTYGKPFVSSPSASQQSFTCEQNDAVVIDSFGTPCLNFTKILKEQVVFVYSAENLSYVSCAIPKNGCTYHVAMMHRLMGYPYEGGGNVHAEENKRRLRNYSNLPQLLLSDNVPKYVVVRNPVHRVLSAYLNKVEKEYQHESQKTPESFHKWIYEDEALKPGMDSKAWKSRNAHWTSQVEFCGFKVRDFSKYLRIFRVEEPDEYVEYMESFLPGHVLKDGWDMPLNKSFRQHALGPRTRSENTTARFFEYMGDLRTYDYLSEVYREDIEYLGYRKEVEKDRESLIEYLEQKR